MGAEWMHIMRHESTFQSLTLSATVCVCCVWSLLCDVVGLATFEVVSLSTNLSTHLDRFNLILPFYG